MKKGPFKMAGYKYPGTSPAKLDWKKDKKQILEGVLIAEGARAGAAGEESKPLKTFNEMRSMCSYKQDNDVTKKVEELGEIDDVELASGKKITNRGGKVVLKKKSPAQNKVKTSFDKKGNLIKTGKDGKSATFTLQKSRSGDKKNSKRYKNLKTGAEEIRIG